MVSFVQWRMLSGDVDALQVLLSTKKTPGLFKTTSWRFLR